jgi:outer membrane biosynthesis protein TonB
VSDFFQRERANLKGRWTALLVLVTCCAVTLLVAQQGETIDRQRTLIQLLWGDSRELNALKVKEFAGRQVQPKPAPDEVTPTPPPGRKPPASKPRAQKPKRPQKPPERQAIERPGPRLLRYI